jgi:HEAT repeat protein
MFNLTKLWRCVSLAFWPLLISCSREPGGEPVYDGKPLSEWAVMTQDQSIDGTPSAEAQKAMDAVRAIGPERSIPFLVKWLQPPIQDSRTPGGAAQCFRIFGPEAKAAIPDLAKILNRPSKTIYDDSAKSYAAKSLSYLGPDAVPVLLGVATNLVEKDLQAEMIGDMANFGTNGAAAKPAILKWSTDSNEWVRLSALNTYVAMEDDKAALVRFLSGALKDPNDLVRRDAADALGEIAKGSTNAAPNP